MAIRRANHYTKQAVSIKMWIHFVYLFSDQKFKNTESSGKLPHIFIPSKPAILVPEFAVEDLLWTELQPWCLSLQWKICPWEEHSDDDDDKVKNMKFDIIPRSSYKYSK